MSEERYRAFYRERDPGPLDSYGICREFEVPDVVDGDYARLAPPIPELHDIVDHDEADVSERHLKLIPGGLAVEQLVRAA